MSVQQKPVKASKPGLVAQVADQFDFLLVNQVY